MYQSGFGLDTVSEDMELVVRLKRLSYERGGPGRYAHLATWLREAATATGSAGPALDAAPQRERFFNALDDDLWTPGAIAACREVADAIHATAAAGRDVAPAQAVLREMAAVLGLWLEISPPTL